MRKKILIATGGTGGHLYPAQALAEQLKSLTANPELLFIGGGLSDNPYFNREAYLFEEVSVATFAGKSLTQQLISCVDICKGVKQSRAIIKQFRPDVVVGFGSYHTLPTLLAAKLSSVPMVLHEANSIPGKVNRLLSKHAQVTGVHFPSAAVWLKGKTAEVELPLREGYHLAYRSKERARNHFRLSSDLFTLLVFGGSQGAHHVNVLFGGAATNFLAQKSKNFQVVHITGDAAWTTRLQQHYDHVGIRAHVVDAENAMDQAWTAADMVVARAGAATIAEMVAFEVPGILIPWSGAMDDHQQQNALFMSSAVGGAVRMSEEGLTSEALAKQISMLIAREKQQLVAMQEAIRHYKKHSRRRELCSVVCEITRIING